jgi:hypothetical protein
MLSSFQPNSPRPLSSLSPHACSYNPIPTSHPQQPPSKRPKIPEAENFTELGEYINRDINLLSKMGWTKFVQHRRRRGDFSDLKINHPAQRLLTQMKKHGAPIQLATSPWTSAQLKTAIKRGPHRSCQEYIDFLETEFMDMIKKDQWVILPFKVAKTLPGLRISPPGVVPQRGRRPRWICDYTWSGINQATLPLAPTASMQFGHALDRYLREILLSDPTLGPVYMLKLDISDGFYRVNLAPGDIPKLGVAFPSRPGTEPLVALPLVLPMGWKNSPPLFSAATETAADIANANLRHGLALPPHPLEHHASKHDDKVSTSPVITTTPPAKAAVPSTNSRILCKSSDKQSLPIPDTITNSPARASTKVTSSSKNASQSPSACHMPIQSRQHVPTPSNRDPCLPTQSLPTKYIDVFVDDFIALCQGQSSRPAVRRTLLHAVDAIFRPTDYYDGPHRREPVSLKKLHQGDLSWSTVKTILGWIINTATMTIHLPPHRVTRLGEILASIPKSQKRTSIKKWHKVLGELRSMSLALPGARNLFSTMQKALTLKSKTRIALHKNVHTALDDFRWMLNNITNRPTRIAEIIPLNPGALGYHDAAGIGAGGVWFPSPEFVPRGSTTPGTPLLWRLKWPDDITANLVSRTNPHGTINNSELELAGGLLQLDIIAQNYDVRERTILSKTDNLATLFWQRKGSTTSTKVPAYLLRLFGIHQRQHRYVPRHDYIPGLSNPMADDASRFFHLSNKSFLQHFNTTYPQKKSFKLVTPTSQIASAVISALRMKKSSAESLWAAPPPATPTGISGTSTPLTWASIPYSKPSKTKYLSYKSSSDAFVPDDLLPANIRSSLDLLKTTYGRLHRRTLQWGPQTPA